MSISNGQNVDAANTNAAFISRTTDSDTVGVVDLKNAGSGADVINVQQTINDIEANIDVVEADLDLVEQDIIDKFDATTGHDHDGINSKKIDISDIEGVNTLEALYVGKDLSSVSGLTFDASSAFPTESSGGDANTEGVITTAPNNYVSIVDSSLGEEIEDGSGRRVYARLTEAAGVWTLSFYVNIAGTETAYNLPSTDISIFYREVFGPTNLRPTIPADVARFDSLNATADIVDASTTLAGKVNTVAQSFSGVKNFVDGAQVTGDNVVTETASQTVTNKTITGASIQTPTRLDVKQDTLANLTSYAGSASDGQIVFATDTQQMFQIVNNTLTPIGGGGSGTGSLDIYYSESFEDYDDTAALTAAFTLTGSGTLVLDETTELNQSKSLKYTQASGSLGDTIDSPSITLYEKQKNRQSKIRMAVSYSGPDDEIEITVGSITVQIKNGVNIISENFLLAAPASIQYQFEVVVENIGAILIVDDIELTTDIDASLTDEKTAYVKHFEASNTGGGSASTNTVSTKVLNNLSGDTSFISLLSNQVTLAAGTYNIDGYAVAYRVNQNQAFLYNVTDAVYVIDGTSTYSQSSNDFTNAISFIRGQITIASTKVFELRHWTRDARASDGFGLPVDFAPGGGSSNNPQTNEVYDILKITKIA